MDGELERLEATEESCRQLIASAESLNQQRPLGES